MHCFWTRSGSSEPLNHDSGVVQRTEGTRQGPSGLAETG